MLDKLHNPVNRCSLVPEPGRARSPGALGLIALGLIWMVTTAGTAGPVFAVGLADHTWRSRPLLVFAPSEDDVRLQRTLGQLRLRRCELDDRDMVIGVLLSRGQSRLGANGFHIRRPRASGAVAAYGTISSPRC